VRIQAIYTLQNLNSTTQALLKTALSENNPAIRRAAIRIGEADGNRWDEFRLAALNLAGDPDAGVRLQLACTLGEWQGQAAADALARIALHDADDPYIAAAVMSSATKHFDTLSDAVANSARIEGPLYESILLMAVNTDRRLATASLLQPVLTIDSGSYSDRQFRAFVLYLNDLSARRTTLSKVKATAEDELTRQLQASYEVFSAARKAASDEASPEPLRLSAVGLLGREPTHFEDDATSLANLLTPRVPGEVQAAAIAALARTARPDLPQILIRNWPAKLPPIRQASIDVLLSRAPWARELIAAVKSDVIPQSDLDAARRQRLLRYSDETVRKIAQQILTEGANPQRQQVIDAYDPALRLAGDAVRGQKLFMQNCSVCHRKNGVGAEIGPDLGSVSAWQPDALLVAILDPNRQVEPRYFAYTAVTTEGDAIYGIITSESGNSLTLKGLDGKERTLLRSQLQSLTATNHSLMPDGLESVLDKQQMADIIRFLRTTSSSK
jgi:putative heme-binding domain-containing protein